MQRDTWRLFLKIVIPGLTIIFPLIGGYLWFMSDRTYEPVLFFIGAMAAAFIWFQTREDRKDQLQDKKHIISANQNEADETRQHIESEHQQTRSVIKNTRSVEYGFYLLREAEWKHIDRQDRFICEADTDWYIIQQEQTHRTFHESWVDNMFRPDPEIKVFRTVLKRNDIEIKEIIFIDMDGSRITMPLPKKQGADTYYYCEGSIEHLMFNIIRQSIDMYHNGHIELKEFAQQAKILWQECD